MLEATMYVQRQHHKTIYFFISCIKKLMFKFRNLNRLQNMTFVRVQCGCIQTIPI